MLLTWPGLLQGRAVCCKAVPLLRVWGKRIPSLKGKYELLVCSSVLFSSECCTASGQCDAEQKQTWTALDTMVATVKGSLGSHHGDSNGQGIHILHTYSSGSLSLTHGKVQLWLWARMDQEYTENSVQLHQGCSGSTCMCLCQAQIQNNNWNPCQYLLAAAWAEVQRKKVLQ